MFCARLVATCGLAVGFLMAGFYIVVLGTLSIPVGITNSPAKGLLFVATAYLVLSLFALVECWRRPPYTRLVMFLAVAPFGLLLLVATKQLLGVAW